MCFRDVKNLSQTLNEVLNPNFQPFSFELRKIRFYKIYFDLEFQSSVTSKLNIFEIIFHLSILMSHHEYLNNVIIGC